MGALDETTFDCDRVLLLGDACPWTDSPNGVCQGAGAFLHGGRKGSSGRLFAFNSRCDRSVRQVGPGHAPMIARRGSESRLNQLCPSEFPKEKAECRVGTPPESSMDRLRPPSCESSACLFFLLVSQQVPLPRTCGLSQYPLGSVWRRP